MVNIIREYYIFYKFGDRPLIKIFCNIKVQEKKKRAALWTHYIGFKKILLVCVCVCVRGREGIRSQKKKIGRQFWAGENSAKGCHLIFDSFEGFRCPITIFISRNQTQVLNYHKDTQLLVYYFNSIIPLAKYAIKIITWVVNTALITKR